MEVSSRQDTSILAVLGPEKGTVEDILSFAFGKLTTEKLTTCVPKYKSINKRSIAYSLSTRLAAMVCWAPTVLTWELM